MASASERIENIPSSYIYTAVVYGRMPSLYADVYRKCVYVICSSVCNLYLYFIFSHAFADAIL